MMSNDNERTLGWFVPAGTMRFSQAVLDIAADFHAAASKARPGEDWIVMFDWSDSRRFRVKGSNDWQDLGAGLDLAVYRRDQVPDWAIETGHAVALGCKIRPDAVERANDKLIDVDPDDPSRLMLV